MQSNRKTEVTLDWQLPARFLGENFLQSLEPFGRFKGTSELCMIKAATDLDAVRAWLADRAASVFTFDNYRKEAERLLLWCAWRGTPLSGLTREDFIAYEIFLSDPQPAEKWIGPAHPRSHPEWKPFVKKLAPSSCKQGFDVLRSLFGYLHSMGYLVVNPLGAQKMARQKLPGRGSAIVERYLDERTWAFLVGFIDCMPKDSLREKQHYERVRWLFTLLYLSSARLSEVARAKMSDFYMRDGLWWWRIYGKGNKIDSLPVSPELHAAFLRYRQFLGLPASPVLDDSTGLVMSVTGRGTVTRKAIHLIVKTICRDAGIELGKTDEARADKLYSATTHWLRHTSATHRVNSGEDLRIVSKKLLRHSSIETTMIYQHSDENAAHAELSKFKMGDGDK